MYSVQSNWKTCWTSASRPPDVLPAARHKTFHFVAELLAPTGGAVGEARGSGVLLSTGLPLLRFRNICAVAPHCCTVDTRPSSDLLHTCFDRIPCFCIYRCIGRQQVWRPILFTPLVTVLNIPFFHEKKKINLQVIRVNDHDWVSRLTF